MKYIVLIFLLVSSFILLACSSDASKSSLASTPTASAVSNKLPKKDPTASRPTTTDKSNKKEVVSSEEAEEQTDPMTKEQLDKAKLIIKDAGDVSDIDAKKLFKQQCSSCHGRKGNLKINGAKKLTKSKIDLENAVARIYFGKGLMTSYRKILSEKEIVAVAKYAQTLKK
ncbi:cytochrome c [Saprospiraceae bacterium]|nr:cytochrome c [Saprospiraceae bacterium]